MAVNIGELLVQIDGNTRQLQRRLDEVERAIERKLIAPTQRASRFFGGLARGAAGLVAIGTSAAIAGKKIFDLGAAVGETESKFRTVFGTASDEVAAFVKDFGTLAGLSQTQAKDLVATTGAIAQGMGFAQAASGRFAEQIIRVSGDLASFNNLETADVAGRIQAALTGERESLKRLGIVIVETDVQQRALTNTGKTNAKQLTQQEKATATLQLITERAGVAIGDLARTQDSAANRGRQLAAKIMNVRDNIAAALLPALADLLPTFSELADKVDANKDSLVEFGRVAIAVAKAAVRSLFNMAQILGEALGELGALIVGVFTFDFTLIKTAIEELKETLTRNVADIIDTFKEFGDDLEAALAGAGAGTGGGGGGGAAGGGAAGGGEEGTGVPPQITKVAKTTKQFLQEQGQSAGRLFVDGIIHGMDNFGQKLGNFVTSFIEEFLVFRINKILGIFSPSRVGAGIGQQFVAGMQMGIRNMAGELGRTAASVARVPVAAAAAQAQAAGPNITVPMDFSGIPAPMTPREGALNVAWQELVRETFLQLQQGGFRAG